MAVQYPTSPFGMEGTSGSPGLDLYSKLVGKEIYYQNVSHKSNNSLYPLLFGVGQRSGTVVSNHASHNHQGGIRGEFIEKGVACSTARPIGISGNLGAVSSSDWINMHPSPVGDKGHMLIVGPPGCDAVRMTFYTIGDWSTSSDAQLAELQFMWQSYGISSDTDITSNYPNAQYMSEKIYGSELQNIREFSFDISGMTKCSDAGPTHKPTMMFGTLSYRMNNNDAVGATAHLLVFGPKIVFKRISR